jgi:hypothetical protein
MRFVCNTALLISIDAVRAFVGILVWFDLFSTALSVIEKAESASKESGE